jgi:hypothetical protein
MREARRSWAVAVLLSVLVCATTMLGLIVLVDALSDSDSDLTFFVPVLVFAVAWMVVGIPLLARATRAPALTGLRAGAVAASGLLLLAFSFPKGSDQPLATFVWAPIAVALLALAAGSVAGLAAQRLHRASPRGGRAAAIVAVAATPGFLGTLLLAERRLDDSRAYEPSAPWGEVALSVLLVVTSLLWLATSRKGADPRPGD